MPRVDPITQPGGRGTRPSTLSEPAIEDLLEEGPLELMVGRSGARGMRTFYVPDVSGAGARVLAAAILAPNVPRIDDPWPGKELLLCSEVKVSPAQGSTTDFVVVASYGFPVVITDPFDNPPGDDVTPFLEIASSVVMRKTTRDIEGNEIIISNYVETPPGGGQPVLLPAQPGEVDIPVRNTVLRYSRRERPVDSQDRLIGDKCTDWTGITNEGNFLGRSEGKWLVVVSATSDDGNETFNVVYELHFNADTWDPTVVYRDPETGRPGSQVGGIDIGGYVDSNGIKRVIVTEKRDLTRLNLLI